MRAARLVTGVGTAAVLASVVGCELSPPAGPQPILSPAAAQDAFTALLALDGFQISFEEPSGGNALREASMVLPMNRTTDCPEGGWSNLSGQLVGDQSTGEIGMLYQHTLSNCRVRSTAQRLWLFHGERGIETSFTANYDARTRTGTITGKVQGSLNIAGNGYESGCDLQFDILVVENVGRFVGTLCGHPVLAPYRPDA